MSDEKKKRKITIPDTFTLDVKKWICGAPSDKEPNNDRRSTGEGGTLLLNTKGYMCCLGQFSKQCGLKDEDIKHTGVPGALAYHLGPFNKKDKDGDLKCTKLSDVLININDDPATTIPEKIRKMKRTLSKWKYKLKIKNAPKWVKDELAV
jgi:hypothetical protein